MTTTQHRTWDSPNVVPPARRANLIVTEIADERLVYDADRHTAHCLNRTAALVWQYCDGTRTVADICAALERDLATPVAPAVVWAALEKLDEQELLETRLAAPPQAVDAARRQFLRTAGWVAAIAAPAVISIAVPTPAQAASCLPTGSACSAHTQCCSGVCTGGFCQ